MSNQNNYMSMKYFRSFFLIVFIFFIQGKSVAQQYGSITNFEILPEYLVNGKIRIILGNPTTTVKFKVTVVRTLVSSYPELVWQPVDLLVGLSSASPGNSPKFVSQTRRITNSDFPDPNSAVLNNLIITVDINNLDYNHNFVLLGFKRPFDGGIQSYNSQQYSIERFNGGIPASLQNYAKEFAKLPSMPMTFIYPSDTTPALTVGANIYSPNQQYRLTLQTDGNVVLYKRINVTTEQPLWASGPQSGVMPKTLFFQTDGNLVLFFGTNINSGAAWASNVNASEGLNTITNNKAAYALQDDGNLVFYWLYAQGNEMYKWSFGSTKTNGGAVSPNFGRIAAWD